MTCSKNGKNHKNFKTSVYGNGKYPISAMRPKKNNGYRGPRDKTSKEYKDFCEKRFKSFFNNQLTKHNKQHIVFINNNNNKKIKKNKIKKEEQEDTSWQNVESFENIDNNISMSVQNTEIEDI